MAVHKTFTYVVGATCIERLGTAWSGKHEDCGEAENHFAFWRRSVMNFPVSVTGRGLVEMSLVDAKLPRLLTHSGDSVINRRAG